jgi:hypothetical protein
MSYPYGDALPNEFQWLEWDPDDEDQKKDGQKIHEAFKQWVRNLSHEEQSSFLSLLTPFHSEHIAKKSSTV